MLAVDNIMNSRAGGTCEMKIDIALITTVEGVFVALFTANITLFFFGNLRTKVWFGWKGCCCIWEGSSAHD
jgi:hypothetical protein